MQISKIYDKNILQKKLMDLTNLLMKPMGNDTYIHCNNKPRIDNNILIESNLNKRLICVY